jgi:hypothetical protein
MKTELLFDEENEEPFDYCRSGVEWTAHHFRYIRYVEAHGLPCQECHGMGGETVPILDYGVGPWESCGWCEGTGLVTKHIRGQWLKYKREAKRV